MTDSEIDALSAGRELDAKIAEHVMGLEIAHRAWPCHYAPDCGAYEAVLSERDTDFNAKPDVIYWRHHPSENMPDEDKNDLGLWCEPVPHYSTDIADAWRIVEHLTLNKHWIDISYNGSDSNVHIERHNKIWNMIVEVDYDDTPMPLAICRAALKVANHGV